MPDIMFYTITLGKCLPAGLFDDGNGTPTCKCKAGYGSMTGMPPCSICAVGTYSEGGTLEGCKSCPFGYTSRPGADTIHECEAVSQACPVGQVAPPGAVSAEQCGCLPGFGGE